MRCDSAKQHQHNSEWITSNHPLLQHMVPHRTSTSPSVTMGIIHFVSDINKVDDSMLLYSCARDTVEKHTKNQKIRAVTSCNITFPIRNSTWTTTNYISTNVCYAENMCNLHCRPTVLWIHNKRKSEETDNNNNNNTQNRISNALHYHCIIHSLFISIGT